MKNKKIVKKLFAGVMAMSLCLGTTMMVSATEAGNTPSGSDVPQSKKVALTKVFDVPENIDTPDATFVFNFQQISEGDSVTDTAKIEPATLKFSKSDTKVNGRIAKETKDVLRNTTFPRAGVYVYRVNESEEASTVTADGGKMTYDKTTYILRVYVKNGDNGPEVDTATVEKEGGEGGNEGKVNPAPSTDTETDSGNGDDGNGSADPTTDKLNEKFAFVNAYNKNGGGKDPVDPDGPDDPDPNAYGLKVTKTVTGDYGDRTYGFSFNLNLTLPASAETAGITSVKGYICDANDNNKIVGDPIDFVNGNNSFTLTHGQYLTFKEIPAGTAYTVTENGTTNYQGSAVIEVNGTKNAGSASAAKGETLQTESTLIGADAGNSTDVTNAFDDQSTTPTGILVNNLPYIAIILVAIIGCAVIVASRKRRAN